MNFHDEIDPGLKKLDNVFRVQIIRGQKTEDVFKPFFLLHYKHKCKQQMQTQ